MVACQRIGKHWTVSWMKMCVYFQLVPTGIVFSLAMKTIPHKACDSKRGRNQLGVERGPGWLEQLQARLQAPQILNSFFPCSNISSQVFRRRRFGRLARFNSNSQVDGCFHIFWVHIPHWSKVLTRSES